MRRIGRMGWLLASAAMLACSAAALAQPSESRQADAGAIANPAPNLAGAVHFDISAGPLEAALIAYGERTGIRLAYPSAVTAGRVTQGVVGLMTPVEALNRLLADTGLSPRRTADSTTTVVDAAYAQLGNAAPQETIGLDTIDVQGETALSDVRGFVATRSTAGSKTDTRIIETPQSISVVTRAQIEEQGSQRVQDALRYSAGVRVEAAGNDTRRNVILTRGFDTGFAGAFMDGLKLPLGGYSGWGEIDAYGIQRIDVMRGPASVLYGQNTPGGVINIISKRPTSTPLREVETTIGSFGRVQGAFDFSGPLDPEGKLLYRVTGLARDAKTQTDFSQADRLFIAPAFTWAPNAATSLTILTSFQRDQNSSGYDQFPALGTLYPSKFGRISRKLFTGEPAFDRYDRNHQFIGYQLQHGFGDGWTFRQNARYGHVTLDNLNVWSSGLAADQRTLLRRTLSSKEELDSFGIDTQLEKRGRIGMLEYTTLLGVDFQTTFFDQRTGLGSAPSLDAYAPVYGARITAPPLTTSQKLGTDQLGFYGQQQLKIGRLTLTGGLRYDDANQRVTNRLVNTPSHFDADATTWRVGAVYETDFGLAPYASYSTSFVPNARTDFYGNVLEPTTGRQYEVGLKFQPEGWNSLFTLAAFDIRQQNVLTTDPDHVGFSIATGEISSRGIEFEGAVNLYKGVSLIGSYSYNDVEVTRSTVASTIGKTPVYVPKHTASLWASYTFDAGALNGLTLGAGVRYVGSTPGDTANTFFVPPVTLADAAIHYDLEKLRPELKGFRASITANNVFDRRYVASCFSSSICYWGSGRTVLASLRYRW